MSKHHRIRPIDLITQLRQELSARHREYGSLAVTFATAFDAERRYGYNFKFAVVAKLARLESIVWLILMGQLIQMQKFDCWSEDKLRKDIRRAKKTIDKSTKKIGTKMVKVIYADSKPEQEPKPGPKRGKTA